MDRTEIADLMADLVRSIQLRQQLRDKLEDDELVDLVSHWDEIQRVDHQVERKIRKRLPE
jgi:hypothetical protein